MSVVARHDDGDVALLVYDVPGERMNTLVEQALHDLGSLLAEVAADDAIAGAVLISGKPDNFCAGADVRWLPEIQELARVDAAAATVQLARAHGVVEAMMDFPKPLVAAVNGVAMGGGLELAMACHERILTDHENTQLAVPEVKLGLLPGAGGTQLLPRLLPLPVALEHLLTGRTMYPQRAQALGLADAVVPVNRLRALAVARVHELADDGEVRWRQRHAFPEGAELDNLLAGARWMAKEQTKGLWPAPDRILDAVEAGVREGLDAGLAKEREGFVTLLASPEAAAGVHLFLAGEAAKKARFDVAPKSVKRVFVLGGGMMGAGLGALAIDRGLDARVRDLDEDTLARARRYADKVLRARYGKRQAVFPYLYREKIHRLSTTTTLEGVGLADVVVEAVFEDTALKHRVIRETEARMRDDAIFASNTSAIPITTLADASSRPDRFIGMHFFSPVEKMPLVEIITHEGTSAETTATTVALGLALGKVPIVVRDSPGFYTSRVFGRWLVEGTRLLAEGARIEQVDEAAEALGFPVGPLRAHDEVSLELVRKAASETTAAITAERVDPEPSRRLVAALVEAGHLGRKAGRGFYRYDDDGKRTGPDDDVYAVAGLAGDGAVADDEVRARLLWSFVTEALLCWDEGILRSTADGDVGAVMGIGFPPNLGGPFFHVDLVGAGSSVAAIERLGEPAFTVAQTLRKLAESGGRYADL